MAKSLEPIVISSLQITRSTNGMEAKNNSGRSSDTMGTKHFVDYGVYVLKGSINAYFAEKTGFLRKMLRLLKKFWLACLKMMRRLHVRKALCEFVKSFGLRIQANWGMFQVRVSLTC